MPTVDRHAYAAVLLLIFSLAWVRRRLSRSSVYPGVTCRLATPPADQSESHRPASGATVSGTLT